MNMSDKIVFSSLKIFREFHDKTAFNVVILYKVQNFYIGKTCISVFYFIFFLQLHLNNRSEICPMVDGLDGRLEFNFVVKFQVDHFDHKKF